MYLNGNSSNILYDPSYVNFKVTQYTSYKNYTSGEISDKSKNLETQLCGNRFQQFFSDEISNVLNLKYMIWTQSLDYVIGGSFLSTEYNYFSISLSKCSGLPYCKSDSDINKAIESISVGVALTDYYFDSNDYENPIQMNPSANLEYVPIGTMKKTLNIKLMKNSVKDTYNYFPYTDSKDYEFFSLGERYIDISNQNITGEFMVINFMLDSKYQVIQRRVFSLLDLIGQIGGVNQIVLVLLSFVMNIFIYKVYIETLLSNFYQLDTESSHKKSNSVLPEDVTSNSKILQKYSYIVGYEHATIQNSVNNIFISIKIFSCYIFIFSIFILHRY